MVLETERLILRPWREGDAADLFAVASHPDVGSSVGWNPHKSVEESLNVIRTALNGEGMFAIILKNEGKAIGSVGLYRGKQSLLDIPENEGEVGFWVGVPYSGLGFIPEAVSEVLSYGFEELKLPRIWCGYFDQSGSSKRFQPKSGSANYCWINTDNILAENLAFLENSSAANMQ